MQWYGHVFFSCVLSFVLNTAEHEIYQAHKCFKNANHGLLLVHVTKRGDGRQRTIEHLCEKTDPRGFPTRSDTNRVVQPHKITR